MIYTIDVDTNSPWCGKCRVPQPLVFTLEGEVPGPHDRNMNVELTVCLTCLSAALATALERACPAPEQNQPSAPRKPA